MTNDSGAVDHIIDGLWNEEISQKNYASDEMYQAHIFEQYRMFVEMADRISSRRNLANTFFLTLNTFLLTASAFLFEKGSPIENPWLNAFPLAAVLALCYTWWRLLKSYRQLNSAKYKIIGEFETRLPSSPYWSAEWEALGEGRDGKKYRSLTDIENWIPVLFAVIYVMVFITILFINSGA